jgi:tetratricopeptide (TPR) repeat protein
LSPINESGNDSRERWQRLRAIFDEVVAVPAGQRISLLEQKCDGDAALMAELYSLIEACQAEEAFAEGMSEEAFARQDVVKRRWIGPYELDRLLGRGGMGAVYLAHRADGQFSQQLAIKLIDLPMATELYRNQFRLERQILARLTHPFIARLLDGGITEDRELYLAMEYIDGISIVQYCEQNHLSLRERLLLFKNVCSAVQYAHQNLVIHRDLKPDNILVVPDGTPRLLDFGTAKLLTELPDEAASEFTLQGLRSFTPQYASPEQVLGRAISTASDIYSLGVLLFHLLADVLPYLLKDFNTEEMLRVICTEQPPRPSAVATSAEPPDADLDAIVLMTLRKEPEERYLTVEQFVSDIQAWLDGRPVLARRGTLRYRAGKFVQRNKLALSAAAILLVALVCGVADVLWQSRVANLERIRAEANAQQMRELSNSFMSEINEAVRDLPGSTPVRRLMVQRVLEHLDRMPQDAAEDRSNRLYLVNAYIHLGIVQGDPYEQNIGDAPGALVSLNKAVTLAQSLHSTYPKDRGLTEALALALTTRSRILYGIGKPQEAITSVNEAIPLLNAEIDSANATPSQIVDAAVAYHLLADELGEPETPSIGDYPNALKTYRQSYDLYERALAIDPNYAEAKRKIASYHLSVGCILTLTDPARAIDEFRKSLSLWNSMPIKDKSANDTQRTILYDTIELAAALTQTRDYKSAVSTYEEARKSIEISAALDSKDSRAQEDLAALLGGEADTYIDMADPLLNPRRKEDRQESFQHAMELLQGSIAVTEKLVALNPKHQMWTTYLANEDVLLGTVEESLSPNSGSQMSGSGVATLRHLASADGASSDVLFRTTSVMLTVLPMRLRDTRLTVHYAERLAALSRHTDPTSLSLLAQAYLADGQIEKAAATAKDGLDLLPPHQPGTPTVRCRVFLEQILSKATPIRSLGSSVVPRTDAVSAFNAGLSLNRQGFKTDARIWYNEALRRKPDEELRQKVLVAMR